MSSLLGQDKAAFQAAYKKFVEQREWLGTQAEGLPDDAKAYANKKLQDLNAYTEPSNPTTDDRDDLATKVVAATTLHSYITSNK